MAAFIDQVKDSGGSNNILAVYARDVTSQYGEDGIIEKIFTILPESDKWCVEFGAWDGKLFSNTYNLIANNGWSGVLIEANENKFKELLETYSGNSNVHCFNRFVDIEGQNCLDNILAETPIPTNFDMLSIDVDGCDYHIWESVTRFNPKLVLVEYNPSVPDDIIFIQDNDFDLNHGNSLRALVELGKRKDYELIATTATNGFFVKSEYFDLFEIEDNSVRNMRDEQANATKIFQLYDGTLLVCGVTRLLWHDDIEIGIDELQILPRSARRIADKQQKE